MVISSSSRMKRSTTTAWSVAATIGFASLLSYNSAAAFSNVHHLGAPQSLCVSPAERRKHLGNSALWVYSTTTDARPSPSIVSLPSDDVVVPCPIKVEQGGQQPSSTAAVAQAPFVRADDDDEDNQEESSNLLDGILNTYLGPRAVLACASILYGTNFALGAIMDDNLPDPSAATTARMFVASLALSPAVFKLSPDLRWPALLCGCFTAMGYVTQSLALADTSPATVSFLGAATVLVCPTLEALVDGKPMGLRDAPQTWLAALLCLAGVGVLELYDPAAGGFAASSTGSAALEIGWGDVLALLQAVGFGTSVFQTGKMLRNRPDQALPITAVQVSTTALLGVVWCLAAGWMGQEPGWEAYALPGMLFEPSLRTAAGAVLWTGLISTAMNLNFENKALGKVPSAEASVILATEPMWAALFASLLLSEEFGTNDYVGGALMVAACLANTLKPSDFDRFFQLSNSNNDNKTVDNNGGFAP